MRKTSFYKQRNWDLKALRGLMSPRSVELMELGPALVQPSLTMSLHIVSSADTCILLDH